MEKLENREKASLRAPGLKILTPYRKGNHPVWLKNVEVYEPLASEIGNTWGKKLPLTRQIRRQLLWAWRLFRLSRNYDVILTGSDRMGMMIGAAQRIFRRRRIPHIYLDFYINREAGNFRWIAWRSLARLALQGAGCAIVQRTCEVQAYSRALDLPASKFKFVPYHATIFDLAVEVHEDGYIFAGGDSHRDYPLLVEAARGLPYRFIIACLRRDHFSGVNVPENVEITTVPGAEFLKLMARSDAVIVPLKWRPLHVGGEQTYLNAMVMGKPTIVTDADASDYIESGVTGVLTPAGNVEALKQTIRRVMEDKVFASALGRNGKIASANFTPEKFFDGVFNLCNKFAAERLAK